MIALFLPYCPRETGNRVAISRAQWAAYLLYSPRLIDYLPPSQAEIAELSRFIQLVSPASA